MYAASQGTAIMFRCTNGGSDDNGGELWRKSENEDLDMSTTEMTMDTVRRIGQGDAYNTETQASDKASASRHKWT